MEDESDEHGRVGSGERGGGGDDGDNDEDVGKIDSSSTCFQVSGGCQLGHLPGSRSSRSAAADNVSEDPCITPPLNGSGESDLTGLGLLLFKEGKLTA